LHNAASDECTSNSPFLFLGVHADNSDLRFQLPASCRRPKHAFFEYEYELSAQKSRKKI